MIRRLRRQHLVTSLLLAALLPVGYAAGLLARRDMPTGDGTGRPVVAAGHELWREDGLWGGLPITTRREAGGPPPGGNALVLDVREDLRRPDLLLYWSLAGGGDGALPEDALLLGSVGGAGEQRFDVPDGRPERGDLILYSLAHQEVVGRASFDDVGAGR